MTNISEYVINGTGSRWTVGTIILVQLITFNETGGPAAMIGFGLAAFYAVLASLCKSGTKAVQISYIRTTHRVDFFCLFLAKWMDILALFSACAIVVRTLSSSLDAMTGGVARMYILGRNSAANEPWPDVIGVVVIFILTGMFMLGLENSRIFAVLMTTAVLSTTVVIVIVTGFKGDFTQFSSQLILPNGLVGLLSGSAIATFSFSNDSLNGNFVQRSFGLVTIILVLLSSELICGCFTTLTNFSVNHAYEAVPLLYILEVKDFHKLIPAVACLLVLICSSALLELFPEMYTQIAQLTKSEWRILAKQIGYESRDSGNPTLTIFTGGSLCAMLAFACPLENLTYILAASHIFATLLRSFHFLYHPLRPHYLEQQNDSSSLVYSRLSNGTNYKSRNCTGSLRKHIWCLRKYTNVCSSSSSAVAHRIFTANREPSPSRPLNNEENEREWLLLGEPSSPKDPHSKAPCIVESSVLSDQISDIECITLAKPENMDTEDSSTDIDAIVDEYKQKVKISTAGPLDRKSARVPTANSWYLAIIFIVMIVLGCVITAAGLMLLEKIVIIVGLNVSLISGIVLWLFPRYSQANTARPSLITCIVTLLASCILFASSVTLSWPALLLWFLVGFLLFIRCDTWCCLCLETPNIRLHGGVGGLSAMSTTTILTSRPSQGSFGHSQLVCQS
ncbi:high affinity cationic amino acid transporter 1 isoform X2 [Anopheles aquasalis]|uniref:high affinity cationic amino acid transporter 1 isoform X2 n=1 Tax=Anopheles aquasalis TaxID=42839 RepID=UPI00215B25BF|nr:high affinity cationic amino acid transporter 1 isoform X2 [Anopheles aquasalis]